MQDSGVTFVQFSRFLCLTAGQENHLTPGAFVGRLRRNSMVAPFEDSASKGGANERRVGNIPSV